MRSTIEVQFIYSDHSLLSLHTMRGASKARSQGSTWTYRCRLGIHTSTHTWSVKSSTHRASSDSARHIKQNAFAHSPHLPFLVSSRVMGLLYLGNLTTVWQCLHLYSSTRDAHPFCSSSLGPHWPVASRLWFGRGDPSGRVSFVQFALHVALVQGGSLHHRKNPPLNLRN